MLTRVFNVENFRGFVKWSPKTEPSGHLRLGADSLIYGRNGSGKSTFSELLRLLSSGEGPCAVHVETDGSSIQRFNLPGDGQLANVHVFNAEYVRRNLSEFLDRGGDCAPLIRLGESTIADAEKKSAIELDLSTIVDRIAKKQIGATDADNKADSNLKLTKQLIIGALGSYNGAKYNPQSFTVTKVKALYQATLHSSLSEEAVAVQLATVNEDAMVQVTCAALPHFDSEKIRNEAAELLARDVLSSPIRTLLENPELADWVERGVDLHSDGDDCKFCSNPLSVELLATYRAHFDDSQSTLKTDLVSFDRNMEGEATAWRKWAIDLPSEGLISTVYRDTYRAQRQAASDGAIEIAAWIDSIRSTSALRSQSVFSPVDAVLAASIDSLDTSDLAETVALHERARESLGSRQATAAGRIEKHYASLSKDQYQAEVKRAGELRSEVEGLKRAQEEKQRDLGMLNAARFDSAALARGLETDMTSYFGHSQFRIRVAQDGDGYAVTRAGAPAHNLSEGERNGIALLYFLRSLEIDGVDPTVSTVVIDDPVSSMDTEAIFAAQALISQRLEPFAQRIILTHDFEFFRLMLQRNRNRWNKSMKRRDEGDSTELVKPRVQFLEFRSVYGNQDGNESRTPELRQLSRGVLRFPTEYHYLFWRVGAAAFDDSDADAPLMANAARRLVEGFIAFKAPNGPNMKSRIDKVAERAGIESSLAERVYRFTNSLSHRDNPNPQVSLNFTSHREELRMIFEFIRRADSHHFDDLVSATGVQVP